jgi:steroid delta-isomerase-like uncharacterized protein
MAAHWSPDGVEDIVPLGVFRGPDEVRRLFGELFAAIPDAEMQVTRVIADDRTAVVEWRMRGNFTGGPFQGVEPTGRSIELRGVDLVEVEDEAVVRNTAYYDGADFARQIGLLPPQDSGAERAMRGAFNTVTKLRRTWSERSGGGQ